MPDVSDRTGLAARPRWSVRLPVDPAYATLCHVGNLELSRLFDQARLAFARELVGRMTGAEGWGEQVIVHIGMDFHAEMLWTAEIELHGRVLHIGRTSYEFELTMWDAERITVRCTTVCVRVANGASVKLSEAARALLTDWT